MPKYVRVNTKKISVSDAVYYLQHCCNTVGSEADLLSIPPESVQYLYSHEFIRDGKLVFTDPLLVAAIREFKALAGVVRGSSSSQLLETNARSGNSTALLASEFKMPVVTFEESTVKAESLAARLKLLSVNSSGML